MNKKISLIILFFIILIIFSNLALAASVTSWKFNIFNDPDARQVAQNIASAQNDMTLANDPIAQFISGINGRIMNMIQQDIVNKMLEDNIGDGLNYEVGDVEIDVTEDPLTGIVTIVLTNIITGEITVIEYDTTEWPSSEDFE
ncbi:curli production assembly/transport component CsgF [Halanaerobium saccharolyticum]|jgi:curli production assembly/transport component CsgF|uniref:Curli production assembly/transport component CsgF n=1 Tax=Halanaerobium saccharolyticum TaxID=43595 RepID=A0A4R6SS41_9FIRM|nr:curli assembly protein CsgF [Halanaerobium saccharolyticum]TDQ06143.1 curli production assembly/transport component CsgF [Halanaerobium saccharolyticum]